MLSMVLLPVFAQIALTFGIGIWMAITRLSSLRNRAVRLKDVSLYQTAWPEKAIKIANSYHNQLEVPILFYILILFFVVAGKSDGILVALSWIFVFTRFVHAFIHTGPNNLFWRFIWFAAGAAILLVMWGYLAVLIFAYM